MPTDITKLPLGGPAWLRAMADDKEEMVHALGYFDAESEREEKREILGLRDAADRLDKTELRLIAVESLLARLNIRVHSGYDFNADPDGISLAVGEMLETVER
jgi:hypothetical protein